MARFKAFCLILCLFFSGLCNFSLAQKLSFHLNPGLAIPKQSNIHSGFESGFGFSFLLTKKLFLSFDFSFWKSKVDEEPEKLLNGKISVTPFFLSLQYNLTENEFFEPYVLFGINIVFNRFEIGDYLFIPEVTIKQKIKNGLGFNLGGGSNIQLTRNWSLFAEILYLFRETRAETMVSDLNLGITRKEFSVSLNSFILKLGIRYFFRL